MIDYMVYAFFPASILLFFIIRWTIAYFDKIEVIQAELDNAIEVAYKSGAIDWVRLNHPKHYKRLSKS